MNAHIHLGEDLWPYDLENPGLTRKDVRVFLAVASYWVIPNQRHRLSYRALRCFFGVDVKNNILNLTRAGLVRRSIAPPKKNIHRFHLTQYGLDTLRACGVTI